MTVHYWLTRKRPQMTVGKFSQASKLFGFTININKTEVLYQHAPNVNPKNHQSPLMALAWKNWQFQVPMMHTWTKKLSPELVRQAKYLGELERVCLICITFSSLQNWVYSAVVFTSLLYRCETSTLYSKHIKHLEKFHMGALHSILQTHWQDRIANLDFFIAPTPPTSKLCCLRLSFAGWGMLLE